MLIDEIFKLLPTSTPIELLCRPHCTLITLHPLLLKCYFPLSYLNNFPRQTHYPADGPGHLIIHQTTNLSAPCPPILHTKIDHGTIHHLVCTKLPPEKAKSQKPKAQTSPLENWVFTRTTQLVCSSSE